MKPIFLEARGNESQTNGVEAKSVNAQPSTAVDGVQVSVCDAQISSQVVHSPAVPLGFDELVRRYGGMVYSTALRVTRDNHDAEDVVQATFLTLAAKARLGEDLRMPGPWLKKVAHRLALDSIRGRKRRLKRENVKSTMTAEIVHSNSHHNADLSESKRVLHEELQNLDAGYRMALVLHYFGGLSRAEMAEQLNIKANTLGVRLHRAREQLRKRLIKRGIVMDSAALAGVLAVVIPSDVASRIFSPTGAFAASHSGQAVSAHASSLFTSNVSLQSNHLIDPLLAIIRDAMGGATGWGTGFRNIIQGGMVGGVRPAIIGTLALGVLGFTSGAARAIPDAVEYVIQQAMKTFAPTNLFRSLFQAPSLSPLAINDSAPVSPPSLVPISQQGTYVPFPLRINPAISSNFDARISTRVDAAVASRDTASDSSTRISVSSFASSIIGASAHPQYIAGLPTPSLHNSTNVARTSSHSTGSLVVSTGNRNAGRGTQTANTLDDARDLPTPVTRPESTLNFTSAATFGSPESGITTVAQQPVGPSVFEPLDAASVLPPRNGVSHSIIRVPVASISNASSQTPPASETSIGMTPVSSVLEAPPSITAQNSGFTVISSNNQTPRSTTTTFVGTAPSGEQVVGGQVSGGSSSGGSSSGGSGFGGVFEQEPSYNVPITQQQNSTAQNQAVSGDSDGTSVQRVSQNTPLQNVIESVVYTGQTSLVGGYSPGDFQQTTIDRTYGRVLGNDQPVSFNAPMPDVPNSPEELTGTNALWINFQGKSSLTPATISQLDIAGESGVFGVSSVGGPLDNTTVGLWQLDNAGTFTLADITVRYDDVLVARLGLLEENLKLWTSVDGQHWTRILSTPDHETFRRDVLNNLLRGEVVVPFNFIAATSPEPATMLTIMGVSLIMLQRRRR